MKFFVSLLFLFIFFGVQTNISEKVLSFLDFYNNETEKKELTLSKNENKSSEEKCDGEFEKEEFLSKKIVRLIPSAVLLNISKQSFFHNDIVYQAYLKGKTEPPEFI